MEMANGSSEANTTNKNGFKIKSRIATISHNGDKETKLKRAMILSYNQDSSRLKQPSASSPQSPQKTNKQRLADIFPPQSSLQTSQ